MKNILRIAAAVACSVMLFAEVATAGDAKDYQVTGLITELTPTTITVKNKSGEAFQINREAATKVKGELKVGTKVLIHYSMTASNIEVKPSKDDSK
jgi:hypothetical protein